MFITLYSALYSGNRPHVCSGSGSRDVPQYAGVYKADGRLHVEEVGRRNLYAEIQSYKDSTDLSYIITRYMNGDPTALSRAQGMYVDITQMPSNMHDIINNMRAAEADFLRLPPDVKEKFGNDFHRFLMTLGTDDWRAAMQMAGVEEVAAAPVGDAIVQAAAQPVANSEVQSA